MQKDFQLNKDLQKEFHAYLEKHSKWLSFELVPTVLAQGYWPFSITEEESVVITPELAHATKTYEKFYCEKHQNRSLKWLFAQGNCNLSSNFFDKKYQFVVNNHQLLIFLAFNRKVKEYTGNSPVLPRRCGSEPLFH